MSEEKESCLSSLGGFLAGIAALITAGTGVFIYLNGSTVDNGTANNPEPPVIVIPDPEGNVSERPETDPEEGAEEESEPIPCAVASETTCNEHGATCEAIRAIDDKVNDLCRWENITERQKCAIAGGIWTPAKHTFALRNPGSVKAGDDGACITQVRNLRK